MLLHRAFSSCTRTDSSIYRLVGIHKSVLYYKWQERSGNTIPTCKKPPKVLAWGAFLFPYCEQGLALRLVARCSLVKPFAQVVADYSCRDGDKERSNNILHSSMHLLSVLVWRRQRRKYSISVSKKEAIPISLPIPLLP